MFRSHLAAEKSLKAVVILRGIPFPKSHDLIRLAQLLQPDDRARFDPNDLAELNPWTIEGRYPADLGDIGAAGAHDLLDRAGRVVNSARLIIESRHCCSHVVGGHRPGFALAEIVGLAEH